MPVFVPARGDDGVSAQKRRDHHVRTLCPQFRRDGSDPLGAAAELGREIDGTQRGARLRN
ncbi:hypothetical protein [Mesorhizobium sp. M0244]|uniref:hypothetical protein n=1 Tax=Mesorhizobium sp. M0244 TaxID=2956926 RepID=UPI0033381522